LDFAIRLLRQAFVRGNTGLLVSAVVINKFGMPNLLCRNRI